MSKLIKTFTAISKELFPQLNIPPQVPLQQTPQTQIPQPAPQPPVAQTQIPQPAPQPPVAQAIVSSASADDVEKHTRFISNMLGVDKAFRVPCVIVTPDGSTVPLDKRYVQADQGSDILAGIHLITPTHGSTPVVTSSSRIESTGRGSRALVLCC